MNLFFSVNNLTVAYDNHMVKESRVLDAVSFDIYGDQITYIHGDNGTGKTSLFRALLGLYEPVDKKFIKLPGQETLISADQFRKIKKVGYIPQFPDEAMVPTLPIIDNIFLREKIFSMNGVGWLKNGFRKSDVARLESLLEEYPIAHDIISGRYYDNFRAFSGGQLQIINLVSVALSDIDMLVMDEPTGKLDEKNKTLFWETLYEILQKKKIVALCITHDKSYNSTRMIAHNITSMKIENGIISPI